MFTSCIIHKMSLKLKRNKKCIKTKPIKWSNDGNPSWWKPFTILYRTFSYKSVVFVKFWQNSENLYMHLGAFMRIFERSSNVQYMNESFLWVKLFDDSNDLFYKTRLNYIFTNHVIWFLNSTHWCNDSQWLKTHWKTRLYDFRRLGI